MRKTSSSRNSFCATSLNPETMESLLIRMVQYYTITAGLAAVVLLHTERATLPRTIYYTTLYLPVEMSSRKNFHHNKFTENVPFIGCH